jgi:signal peptidase I
VTTGAVRVGVRPSPRSAQLKTIAAAALCAVAASVLWLALAPPQVGGATSFAVVDGSSMLPSLQRNDLVLIRKASTYRVGDVVAYRSDLIHRVVLHRIVAIHGGRYTFKGDNNSFLDPEQPTSGAFVGKKWTVLPGAGRVVNALHSPLVAAGFAGILVLLFGFAGAPRREPALAPE